MLCAFIFFFQQSLMTLTSTAEGERDSVAGATLSDRILAEGLSGFGDVICKKAIRDDRFKS